MNSKHKQICTSFEEIRHTFDPDSRYIVIEDRNAPYGGWSLDRVTEVLADFRGKILNRQICQDKSTGRPILIIQIDHHETEEIMLQILGSRLKNDFNCYVY